MAIPNLFRPTIQAALPLSKGADVRMSVYDDTTVPSSPWPAGTSATIEINNGPDEVILFEAELIDGRLDFVINNERTDKVPATTSSNKVAWRLRVAFADDPTVELAVYEGPIYRGKHG